MSEKLLTREESLKSDSNHLRGNIAQELVSNEPRFSDECAKLLKFHGMYQQDDRDKRRSSGVDKIYTLMVRGRIPGGRLSAAQYLVWDDLASRYANGTLRITTRQSFQLHGVLKRDVKATIRAIHEALLTTSGACGDVVRNVTQAINPLGRGDLAQLEAVADALSHHFKARSPAYTEIFLDDEPVHEAPPTVEPIFGSSYLPRKFKLGVTLAGNNSIDLYTNDMGFAATLDAQSNIDGYFVFAGGGMGLTHNKPSTFPRAADLLGWVPKSQLIPMAEAIVQSHRDWGDRTDRKHARLKYVLAEKGVDWFRSEVERRSGTHLQNRSLPPWSTPNYLGWQRRVNGDWTLGIHVLSGRIRDSLKTALREILSSHPHLKVQLTPDQDLLLLGIRDDERSQIESRLSDARIHTSSPGAIYDRALACPALPTCGLAITEAERYLPQLLPEVQKILDELDLNTRAPVLRLTGCPNGCARPYSAELGIVGRGLDAYALYAGGDLEGTRVGRLVYANIKARELPQALRELFSFWKAESPCTERFGDFAHRIAPERIKERIDALWTR